MMSKKYNFFDKKRLIPKLIIIIPLLLVLVVSFFMGTFYIDKVEQHFEQSRKNSINEYIISKKKESEIWVNQLNSIFKYESGSIKRSLKKELKNRVNQAYDSAKYIYEKYKDTKSKRDIQNRIKDALTKISFNNKKNYIFITSTKGISVMSGSREYKNKNLLSYEDSDGRAIVLEEITKIKKHKEGFINTIENRGGGLQTIYVKDIGFFDWYIGSTIYQEEKLEHLKENSLDIIHSTPISPNDFMIILDDKKPIYRSTKAKDILSNVSLNTIKENLSKEPQWFEENINGYFYYSKYIEAFDWHIVYGFNISKMSESELQKQKNMQILLNKEIDFMTKISMIIVILVVLLSIIFSRTINRMFSAYQDEVNLRQQQLELLNASLEQRVARELHNLRKKDKMLIQQAKMADMGDMLSMIAHQWRQPLNQLSYIFMNIDSAYEYKELDKKYLDTKIKEANNLLEFMSQTIDDFRNYFKPVQKRELVNLGGVVERGLELIIKPLESEEIQILHVNKCNKDIEIYVNEFVQVMLNLIKNAKDALLENRVKDPKIEILSKCSEDETIVEVRDNAGGIEEKIIGQIFEPYFTTKDKKNGTGLGLYMSKMIVEEHLNAKIVVENTDEGACFKIIF